MIKSEVVTNARVDNSYPKLMITSDGDIVLFTSISTGTLVFNATDIWPVGDYDVRWTDEDFTDFEGTITLSNGSEQDE